MARRWLWLGGIAGVCGLGVVVWAFSPEAPRPPVRHQDDLVFARPGGEVLRLDMALPSRGDGPFPAVVCLHGGGWTGGTRKQMAQTIDVLARRGFVAVSPDYRLAPKHRFPACVEDCKAAVRWLRANAGQYGVDPKRIGIVGLAAGGHLACMLGTTGGDASLEGHGENAGRSSAVQAVVSLSGPTDLLSEGMHTPELLKLNLVPLLGGPPATHRDAYRKASPLHQELRSPPPFLLIHGTADKVVPADQARELGGKLRAAGGSAQLLLLEGEVHTRAGANLLRSIDTMLTFLDEALKK